MAKQTRKRNTAKTETDRTQDDLQIMDADALLVWETKLGQSAGADNNGASLRLFDGQSGECVVEIALTAQQLGRLVSSHGRVRVKADWQPIVRPAIKALVSPYATGICGSCASDKASAPDPLDEPGVEPRQPDKAYLEVVNIQTKKVARRLDMTGKSENHVDRVERGMLINMSDDYSVDRIGC